MAAEPEDLEEEDPLEKTQPVRRAPGGFRPTSIPEEADGTEEREAIVQPVPRAQLSPAAQAELAKSRRNWGGWFFLLLLLAIAAPPLYLLSERGTVTA